MAYHFNINNTGSLDLCISPVSNLVTSIGFSRLERNLIISAISEIATNMIKYAKAGTISIELLANNRGVKITAEDHGPGIADLDQATTDGFSADPTSLGVGLGAARRAMDLFRITSNVGKGTVVIMEKWLPMNNSIAEYGVISLPDRNYAYNGDSYLVKEYDGDCMLAAIIDGLGEGFYAWKAAELIKNEIEENYRRDLKSIIQICHSSLKKMDKNSGAAIGLLRILPHEIYYAGVGDTFAKVFSDNKINLTSQQGIVGAFPLPNIRTIKRKIDGNITITMCTDGIKDHFAAGTLPLDKHAQYVANYIFNNYKRKYGDATALVINYFIKQ